MRSIVILSLAVAIASTQASAQVDVLTQHNDNQRSGLNIHETVLNHQSVKANFGKLWTLFSDSKIMAQPLYVSNLKSPHCPTGCNTVIFGSMKGTLYAYEADKKPQTENDTLVWARWLGPPQAGSGEFDMWATDDPFWGILGTPVIDRSTNSIYAVVWNQDTRYRLYNVALDTGAIKQAPVVIEGSLGPKNFIEGAIQKRKQRAGLLLSDGVLYVAFGGDDSSTLSGWLFVYDASTLKLKTIWSPIASPNPSDLHDGGIWQSGQGLATDNDGNVFLQTGNGVFDSATNKFGNSLLRLKLDANKVAVEDFFSPCNQRFLNVGKCDLDLGSAGPVLFDDFIVGGGKSGELYLMGRTKLGKNQPGPVPPANPNCMAIPQCQDGPLVLQKWKAANGHIHGTPIVWNGPSGQKWLYVMGEGSDLNAYPFEAGKFKVNDVRRSSWDPTEQYPQGFCGGQPMHWMPGGIMSVSSKADTAGTGIVWVLVPANGDANSFRGVKGMLLALDAEDVSKELWRSQGQNGAADTPNSFGLLARFVAPTVANGKVFVPTAGDKEKNGVRRFCGANPRPIAEDNYPANYFLAVYGLKN